MAMFIYVTLTFWGLITVSLSQSVENCKTPSNANGTCIEITKCPLLYSLTANGKLLSQDDVELIRDSKCGESTQKSRVCCPNISTASRSSDPGSESCHAPNLVDGLCQDISAEGCANLRQILAKPLLYDEDATVLKASECKGTKLYCCKKPEYLPTRVSAHALPEPGVCGVDGTTNKIIGGDKTTIDEYPWMALIKYNKIIDGFGYHCGGALISELYVATAAHCIKKIPMDWTLVAVRLGEWDINSEKDCEKDEKGEDCADPPLDVDVEEQIAHELYSPMKKSQKYDIGLLRLKKTVTYTFFIKPVCLAKKGALTDAMLANVNLFTAGWGATEDNVQSSIKLKVKLPSFEFSECKEIYKRRFVTLDETQICAGGTAGFDSCKGDSGGPLLFQPSGQFYWYMIGIVSFGFLPCGTEGIPGVYTNIDSYIDWIEANIKS